MNEVCQACSRELGESALAIYGQVPGLKHQQDALEVIEGLCCVASELPYEKCVEAQRKLATPMVTTLNNFLANPKAAAEACAAARAASGAPKDAASAGIGTLSSSERPLSTTAPGSRLLVCRPPPGHQTLCAMPWSG